MDLMEGSDKQQLLEQIRGAKSLDVPGIVGQVSHAYTPFGSLSEIIYKSR
eukprot:COSAG01_NODE_5067_length_4516_cov_456.515961_1_plen_50_part_00